MFRWLTLINTTSSCVKNKLDSKYRTCIMLKILEESFSWQLCRTTGIYCRFNIRHKLGQPREIILENEYLFIAVSKMILFLLILNFLKYDVLHFYSHVLRLHGQQIEVCLVLVKLQNVMIITTSFARWEHSWLLYLSKLLGIA